MRTALLLAGFCLLPCAALSGPMSDACAARGGWDVATCTCMQRVADETLESADQELAVAYISRRTSVAQIATSKGQSKAEQFLADFTAFGTQSKAACGAP